MKKRVLSALLVLCMACSMVSTVWATEETVPTPTPTATVEPQSGEPTPTPSEAPTASPDATEAPERTAEPSTTPDATAEPTATPDATEAPAATQTPAPGDEARAQAEAEAAALPEAAAVPEGYTEQRTVRDAENGFTVTVYAREGVIPADAVLCATLMDETEHTEEYAKVEQELEESGLPVGGDEASADTAALNAENIEDAAPPYGFAALDIHFEDADGNEIEPNGEVFVSIDASGLIPEEADPDSVTIQHHEEQPTGEVTVEAVADAADETAGIVEVTTEEPSPDSTAEGAVITGVQAAFEVESFSIFTIRWDERSGRQVTVYYVDQYGGEIEGSQRRRVDVDNREWVDLDEYGTEITGYTYQGAHLNRVNGTEVKWVRNSNGSWYYSISDREPNNSGTRWTGDTSKSIYLVYSKQGESGDDEDQVRVYVYVSSSGISDECLELLGIDSRTKDQNGYFPAGEITLDSSYFDGKGNAANTPGAALIKTDQDWQTLLDALGDLNTSTLADKTDWNIWSQYYDRKDYSVNQGNHVGDYINQARGDRNYTWGSQHTALFRWHEDPYSSGNVHCGFVDQTVKYHLDLFFTTNTIEFILGNNDIWNVEAKDGTLVDSRTYITGSEIQPPEGLNIPDGYYFDGYYEDDDFETPWNGIGSPLTQDEKVYIKLSKDPVLALTITKEVSGTDVTNKQYDFTISTQNDTVKGQTYRTNTNTNITFTEEANGTYTATVALNAKSQNGVDGSVMIYGLPTGEGTTYTVTETADSAKINGFDCETTYQVDNVNGNVVQTGSGASAITAATVEVTNTYQEAAPATAKLTLSKTFDGLSDAEVEYLIFRDGGFGWDVNYCTDNPSESASGDLTYMAPAGDLEGITKPGSDDTMENGGDFKVNARDCLGILALPSENYVNNETGASLTKDDKGNWTLQIEFTVPVCDENSGHFFTVYEQHQDVPGYAKINDSNAEYTITGPGYSEEQGNNFGTGKFVDIGCEKNIYEDMDTEFEVDDKKFSGNDARENTAVDQEYFTKLRITGDTTIAFTNHYTGKLDVTKAMEEDDELNDPNKEYTITIQPANLNKLDLDNNPNTVTHGLEGKTVSYQIVTKDASGGDQSVTGGSGTRTLGEDGSFTIQLKAGETVRFTDMPAIQWQVLEGSTENDVNGYERTTVITDANNGVVKDALHWNGYGANDVIGSTYATDTEAPNNVGDGIVSVDSAVRTIEGKVNHNAVAGVTVTNKYTRITHTLTIKKDVTGELGDTNRAFTFTTTGFPADVTYTSTQEVWNADGNVTTVESNVSLNRDGTFTLKDGQSVTFTLPEGTSYTVTEDTVEGYEQSANITSGVGTVTVCAYTVDSLTKDTSVTFTNRKELVGPPTGLDRNDTPYTLMITAAGIAGLALIGAVVNRRIRRRRQE